MADVVRMPKMSDTMTEGVIVDWHKKVGDKIKPGDVLAEIETDKAVMEFESFQEGTLLYIGPSKGQAVKVDDVIAVLGKEGEDYKVLLNGNDEKQADQATVPEIQQEQKKEEDKSPEKNKNVEKKPDLQPAQLNGEKEPPAKDIESAPLNESSDKQGQRIKASPLAKKIAGDSRVPLDKIKGSGDDGRIVRRDVEKFLTEKPSNTSPAESKPVSQESFEEVPVSLMRKTIARRLAESKFSAPHFYLTMEINMDRSADMRAQINELHPEQKISFNDIIIKSAALSLRKNPGVNSSWLGDKIRYNHHIHIGMAVAVDEGLLVPVIRFADEKTFSQINSEAKLFAAKAKEKKLQPDEMQGNTFTISNLGMMDIDEFTAIINPPDACILAVGRIKKQPVVIENTVTISNMMKLTMSCDHRVVDGATGARFLQTLKSYLENPISMLY